VVVGNSGLSVAISVYMGNHAMRVIASVMVCFQSFVISMPGIVNGRC
jgi:hypothetical protein